MKPTIEDGEIVQCPHCKTDLYEIVAEIKSGMIIEARFFKSLLGIPPLQDGKRAECPECLIGWSQLNRIWTNGELVPTFQIHLKNKGWFG